MSIASVTTLSRLSVVMALVLSTAQAKASPQTPAIQVAVLGVYHMGNPGKDLHNITAEDPRSAKRQRELEMLSAKLAGFRPTKIAIEAVAQPPAFHAESYPRFTLDSLNNETNENAQIGFRLAKKLGHAHVYGFDEQPTGQEPDYYPFDKVKAYAESRHQLDQLTETFSPLSERASDFERSQKDHTITQLLQILNNPQYSKTEYQQGYVSLMRFGDGEQQPGADLLGLWYMRNAKMFAKIINISEPGDRVLIVVGAGHRYWLTHFAANTPGFENVEISAYLDQNDDQAASNQTRDINDAQTN